MALGKNLKSAIMVATDTDAVKNRINALSRYAGYQNIEASTRCVSPHRRMNAPKYQKMDGSGTPRF